MLTPALPPLNVIWDLTHACPLRCTHCYSESGRRASRQLSREDRARLTEVLVSMRPSTVLFSGGEPLLIEDIFELAERLVHGGVKVALYTSGWLLEEKQLPELLRLFSRIHVSVDGATAEVHDSIRGRPGSFDRAMRALSLLDGAAAEQRRAGGGLVRFGMDCVVMQSNFHQLEQLCSELAPRFPELQFLVLGAAIPAGLANREGFARSELLTDEQWEALESQALVQRLQALAPSTVEVQTSKNLELMFHPEHFRNGTAANHLLLMEPDGAVRGLVIYEGTVGNLLEEPPEVLWERVLARRRDPFLEEVFSSVRTMGDWAEAARRIDYHFGSEAVRTRIARRPQYARSA